MAKRHFESARLTIRCPRCGQEHRKSIAWLRNNTDMPCAGCGQIIALESEELRAGIDEADQALADFRRNLSRFNKRR